MEILEILALQLDILERNLRDESKKENINHDAVKCVMNLKTSRILLIV